MLDFARDFNSEKIQVVQNFTSINETVNTERE